MNTRSARVLVLFVCAGVIGGEIRPALACEMCTIPRLGRQEKMVSAGDAEHKWFFEFLFEEQNWDELDPAQAHSLHHSGHHAHDKTAEYFYHFTLGRHLNENVSMLVNLPYVVRTSRGIEHANLGSNEQSEGVGDLQVILNYKALRAEDNVLGLVGGVKFPTGETRDEDSTGTRFEPELQPGSGSYDFLTGAVYEHRWERVIFKSNITYTFKNEGSQNFRFGDVLSSSIFLDYMLNPDAERFKTIAGVDINYQFAQKDEENGTESPDSGAQTIFVGPTFTVEGSGGVSIFGNVMFPVMQNVGGVHQELDYTWTAGAKLLF